MRRAEGVSPDVLAEVLYGRGSALKAHENYLEAISDFHDAGLLGHTAAPAKLWEATNGLSRQKQKNGERVDALLITGNTYAGMTADLRRSLDPNDLKIELSTISVPAGMLFALDALKTAAPAAAAVTECGRLASHPTDPFRVRDGVPNADIDTAAAMTACDAAISQDGKQDRYYFQRARAHGPASDEAAKSTDEGQATAHRSSELAELRVAMDLGYPIAANNLADLYANGGGVKVDPAQAAALQAQFFNRTIACCWVPVARRLLAEEDTHDAAMAAAWWAI